MPVGDHLGRACPRTRRPQPPGLYQEAAAAGRVCCLPCALPRPPLPTALGTTGLLWMTEVSLHGVLPALTWRTIQHPVYYFQHE